MDNQKIETSYTEIGKFPLVLLVLLPPHLLVLDYHHYCFRSLLDPIHLLILLALLALVALTSRRGKVSSSGLKGY